MIVSIDYSYVTASGASEWMKRMLPDKRSWWIDPYGEVHDAGHNHDQFVREHPEIFGTDEPNLVEDFGWVRVGSWGQDFAVTTKSLSQKKLDEAQRLYRETNKPFVVVVIGGIQGRIPKDEFLQANSVTGLLKELRGRSAGRRKAGGDDRAWFISPKGQLINCGDDHGVFLARNQDLFREMGYNATSDASLVKDGWARVGLLWSFLYIQCNELTTKYFDIFQGMVIKLNPTEVQLMFSDGTLKFSRKEFLEFESPSEVKRHLLVLRRKTSSLPKSRNFLMGVDIEDMGWPLRQAFDLLNLSEKKDKLTANQVASAFQANDEFLQDNVHRTATELIQELNGFFQYGPPKEQMT